jgi:hypothetical protein
MIVGVDVHLPVPEDIARLATLVALRLGVTVSELVSTLIRQRVDDLARPDSVTGQATEREQEQVLSVDARAVLDLVSGANLELVSGWVSSVSLQQAAVEAGLWRELHENLIAQRLTGVMAELGLTRDNRGKRRIDIRAHGQKPQRLTVFSAAMIAEAVRRHLVPSGR